ncbi:MAG: PIN-like domain-containing protein [Proteus vulgaris]|uniref:PIN-like domain-containing protein n=1 Tax=Proteus terrae TaxID=1574161 RepID=UPI00301D257B
MRSIFKGFYDITSEEEKEIFNSDDTFFIFDTNCFFNLYRCEEDSKNDFISVVDVIKSRVWFPFQVCLEYQRNRLSTINGSLNELQQIEKDLKSVLEKINYLCGDKFNIKSKYQNLHEDLVSLRNEIKEKITQFCEDKIKSRVNDNDYISNPDKIREWIDKISEGRIGEQLPKETIEEINKDGEIRYKNKIGPGWSDNEKSRTHYYNGVYYDGKYGDLYLWKEILKKSLNEENKNFIFITNDVKDDWWYKIDGKLEPIGHLEHLKTEILSAGASNFKMYTQSSFLQAAKLHLDGTEIKEQSIEEFEILNKSDEKPSNYNETKNISIFDILMDKENRSIREQYNSVSKQNLDDFDIMDLYSFCNYESAREGYEIAIRKLTETKQKIRELELEYLNLKSLNTKGIYDSELEEISNEIERFKYNNIKIKEIINILLSYNKEFYF